MDNNAIEEYLKKLKDIEETLGSEENIDSNFMSEIDNVLSSLYKEIPTEQPQKNIINTQPAMAGGGTLVKVKKLDPNAVIPSYSKVGDAGMDLTITREIENTSFSVSYGFGIAMEIPKGFVGLVFPRSSVRNQDLILSNV